MKPKNPPRLRGIMITIIRRGDKGITTGGCHSSNSNTINGHIINSHNSNNSTNSNSSTDSCYMSNSSYNSHYSYNSHISHKSLSSNSINSHIITNNNSSHSINCINSINSYNSNSSAVPGAAAWPHPPAAVRVSTESSEGRRRGDTPTPGWRGCWAGGAQVGGYHGVAYYDVIMAI